ncbi:class I SAM-dependent methyltransferase [Planktothrix agardhii]|jgi:ubiquinone/menaquinone biosynthesis C-methylase UbiE|uniref:Methyltransferase n=7 Tax=Planktothrix agardhii TaxID=1160 RepID=A0A1U9WVW1_PLAA1|nr:class I SAM-dependent methyltransferase [Planktothrix agardhii]AQY60379.1 methyltransferase [Planktothrix agardhii NIVA-CYA 126/8]AQY60555.1 methyltransferase [Planktothrix agardhii No66]AQY60750.1 methyltransferase [Planktothrix agardhii No365]MBG0747102.1 class I SAM-dependent methyltransferase [Planktothrix agardhii KL2]MCB8749661.1 class I SAM-dependent methyltransferase [Planktothrix agardhii 1810]
MERIPEPEVMDNWEEAREYDAMDFTQVNQEFTELAIELGPETGLILDAGTGTARIPILIAQRRSQWQITGIDLSANMLFIGNQNVEQAGLEQQIKLEQIDSKQLPYPDATFDMVISNSIVHHLTNPLLFFQEIQRLLKPQGGIFLRDLTRPSSETELNSLVEQYARDCNEHQKKLFRDSLNAAYTLDEIINFIESVGLENMRIYQSSDRHWTAERSYRPPK